ncbi:MAG: substrate-binding domain-containing protein [Anaerolineae bacterium]|nr:substrate-binding domain-containing protein [Anaerolineae bacterium]
MVDLIDAQSIDGLVCFQWWQNEEWFNEFYSRYRPLPVVNVMRLYEGYPGVAWNNEQVVRDLVHHLVTVHGYRKIAYVARQRPGNQVSDTRRQAYIDALAEHGIDLDSRLVFPGSTDDAQVAVRYLLDEQGLRPGEDLEAIIPWSDTQALGLLSVLRARGVRVPYDVAVVGIDDMPETAVSMPPLTTVRMPRYEMGKQATELMLAQLRGDQVLEQTVIRAPLVIRQSCGCVDAVVAKIATPIVLPTECHDETLSEVLAVRQEQVLADMAQAAGGVQTEQTCAARVLDAFVGELDGLSSSFIVELDDVLRAVEQRDGDVGAWQDVLSVMRRHLLFCLGDVQQRQRGEDLVQQGRVFVERMAQQTQARKRARVGLQADMLHEIGTALSNTLNMQDLGDVLARELPLLGITSAYLSLYENPLAPAARARLIFAYTEQGQIDLGASGKAFPTQKLVPEDLWPQDRSHNFVLLPLYVGEQQLGFVLLEAGPRDGTVYAVLCEQISGTLYRVLLSERMTRRARQLQAAAEVSGAANSILDPDALIQQVVSLVRERFDLYYVGLFLVEDAWAVLRAGTGQAGEQMVASNHRLAVGGQSMIGQCVATGEVCIAQDVANMAVRQANPLLPETRSELALPLRSRGETIGALTVQSDQSAAFNQEDIIVLQTMAAQLANAIANARLYDQTQEALESVRATQRRYVQQAWERYASGTEASYGYFRAGDEAGPTTDRWLPVMAEAVKQQGTIIQQGQEQGDMLAVPLTVAGEVIGVLGGRSAQGWHPEDIVALEAVVEQVSLALENQRLFEEAQRATSLMGERVGDLDCLNDIGHKTEETPSVPEFLQWVTERIPLAMRRAEMCVSAIEFDKQVYGVPEALDLPSQIVMGLRIGSELRGRVCIAYTEAHEFVDEESALLGDVARRVSGYIENQELLHGAQARAEQEGRLRQITDRLRGQPDVDSVLRTLARELGQTLGRRAFVTVSGEGLARITAAQPQRRTQEDA